MTDWRDEQIGLRVSRCPADNENPPIPLTHTEKEMLRRLFERPHSGVVAGWRFPDEIEGADRWLLEALPSNPRKRWFRR